jgi:hypothetical protein
VKQALNSAGDLALAASTSGIGAFDVATARRINAPGKPVPTPKWLLLR